MSKVVDYAVKFAAAAGSFVAAVSLGESAGEGFLSSVDWLFLETGNAKPEPFMKHPGAKIFKGYAVRDPYTGKIKAVSKKKFMQLTASLPKTKYVIKHYGKYAVFALATAGISKVFYDKFMEIYRKPVEEDYSESLDDIIDELDLDDEEEEEAPTKKKRKKAEEADEEEENLDEYAEQAKEAMNKSARRKQPVKEPEEKEG